MCGLAGLCLADDGLLDATAVARLLTAGIAERGSDATGFAYLDEAGDVQVEKDSLPLARYFERLALPAGTRTAIAHVREFTKGVPGVNDNNHPIRYGSVVGAHNGHLSNDDALFAPLRKAALHAADHGRLRGDHDARRHPRRRRRGARAGARRGRRGGPARRPARPADAGQTGPPHPAPRPGRRDLPVRLDPRAARARARACSGSTCTSRSSPTGRCSSCTPARSSSAAASTSTLPAPDVMSSTPRRRENS